MCKLLEICVFSKPDMFIVFILTLSLTVPPITIYIYLWTSVARFYEEIKKLEEALAKISRSTSTVRLIVDPNPMRHHSLSLQQPNSSVKLRRLTGSTILAADKDKPENSVSFEDRDFIEEYSRRKKDLKRRARRKSIFDLP